MMINAIKQLATIAVAILTMTACWPSYGEVLLVLLTDGFDALSRGLLFGLYVFAQLFMFFLAALVVLLGALPADKVSDARPSLHHVWLMPSPAMLVVLIAWLAPAATAGTALSPLAHLGQWALLCLTVWVLRWRLTPA